MKENFEDTNDKERRKGKPVSIPNKWVAMSCKACKQKATGFHLRASGAIILDGLLPKQLIPSYLYG